MEPRAHNPAPAEPAPAAPVQAAGAPAAGAPAAGAPAAGAPASATAVPVDTPEMNAHVSADEARRARALAANIAMNALYSLKERRFSKDRLDAFRDAPDDDTPVPTILGRYAFSVAFAETLYPLFHVCEVTLRNATYTAIAANVGSAKGVDIQDCWLDFGSADTILSRSQGGALPGDFERVQAAKGAVRSSGRELSAGRLIAELSFGFWTGLYSGFYGARQGQQGPLKPWPKLLATVFPNYGGSPTRAAISDQLNRIRLLRNRAYHHEPLWNRKLSRDVAVVLQTIQWMDKDIARYAERLCRASDVQSLGVDGHRKRMQDIAVELDLGAP